MVTPKETHQEEYAFGFILEVLTQGLYPNVLDVLREYVQNSYDAILKHRKQFDDINYKIKININGRSLFISDNGIGMDEERIKQYRYVGFSDKKLGEEAGFRGIGKLSGISVAERLIITSKAYKSPRRYTLIFNAQTMLSEILKLKTEGKNKPLNDLIRDNTEISSKEDEKDDHFTIIELQNIREEHSILLDSTYVADYVSKICPTPLHPSFKYREEINTWLTNNVSDYVFLPHYVNDQPVYKPYSNSIDKPTFHEIEKSEDGEPIAYAWACANLKEEQLPETGPRGINFRLKNISIGDHEYARTLLWKTSGHLAYWFFGELHIVDTEILPSSERNGFIDNEARQKLVGRGQKDFIKKLEKIARDRSGRANAEKKLQKLEELIKNTQLSLNKKELPRESSIFEVAKLINALVKAESSQSKLSSKRRLEIKKITKETDKLVAKITSPGSFSDETCGIFDIKENLSLSDKEWKLYDLIIDSLKDFFSENPDNFSKIIKQIQEKMIKEFGVK